MPTIAVISGLRVVIYPNDHRPAHVHVEGGGKEAVFNLHCPDGQPELRENYGFAQKELSKIAAALSENQTLLCLRWREIHGNF